jgi:hypothetical protein
VTNTHQVSDVTVTPARTLRDAALYLIRHGWIQGDGYGDTPVPTPTPPACVLGAIEAVTWGYASSAALNVYDEWDALAGRVAWLPAIQVLEDYLITKSTSYTGIADWNDTPGRTSAEVVAALRAAAERWDNHPTRTPLSTPDSL